MCHDYSMRHRNACWDKTCFTFHAAVGFYCPRCHHSSMRPHFGNIPRVMPQSGSSVLVAPIHACHMNVLIDLNLNAYALSFEPTQMQPGQSSGSVPPCRTDKGVALNC